MRLLTNHISAASCLILAVASCFGRYTDNCELPVRKRYMEASWQTSSDPSASCFNNRNSTAESVAIGSTRYFRTSVNSENLHWFVVKFVKPLPLASVTIVSCSSEGDRKLKDDIEVWISAASQLDFGSDHCTADPKIIYNFFRTRFKLRCNLAQTTDRRAGTNWTTDCTQSPHHARFLVLLKQNDTPMGFSDLRVQLRSVEAELSLNRSVPAKSNFSVDCRKSCGHRSGVQGLQLCLPNGTCNPLGRADISSANQQDSGSYMCRDGEHFSELVAFVHVTAAEQPLHPVKQPIGTQFLVAVIALVVTVSLIIIASFGALKILRNRPASGQQNPMEYEQPVRLKASGCSTTVAAEPSTTAMAETYADIYCDE
uniref:CUB domain-containing protein n=1 Tax=Macrostomum lignano TaxID=282301 RepID=A0A1I8JC46_9PLAT